MRRERGRHRVARSEISWEGSRQGTAAVTRPKARAASGLVRTRIGRATVGLQIRHRPIGQGQVALISKTFWHGSPVVYRRTGPLHVPTSSAPLSSGQGENRYC